jgi:hypothetical protein
MFDLGVFSFGLQSVLVLGKDNSSGNSRDKEAARNREAKKPPVFT